MKAVTTKIPERVYRHHVAMFPILSVDLVVRDRSGRVLLLKRNNNNLAWKADWATPGGRVFRNEKLSEAARRVLAREASIGLPKEDFHFLGVQELLAIGKHGVSGVFEVTSPTSKVKLDETSSAAKWFKPDEFPKTLRPEYLSILALASSDGRDARNLRGAYVRHNKFDWQLGSSNLS